METSINIVEKISVFLNKVDPSIHPNGSHISIQYNDGTSVAQS
jgi:hypothetical protein